MLRRSLVITVFVIVVFACAASSALAYGPYRSYPVDGGARLVPGTSQAVVMWPAEEGGGISTLRAIRYSADGSTSGPVDVVAGIAGLDGWSASGDGLAVTVVWKSGSSVFAKKVDLESGTPAFAQVTLSSNGSVVPAGIAADISGGAYIWCAPSGSGATILDHVSSTGQLKVTTITNGAIAAVDVDSAGHAFVLLGPPGRSGLAMQRYAPDLTSWGAPIPVYSAFERPSGAAQTPIGLFATSTATVAWREGPKVRLQRYSSSGLLWMFTAAVTMTGDIKLADDRLGGAYLVGPSGTGVITRHMLASGLETGAPGSAFPGLGLSRPHVDALTVNRAGDLFVACSDAATASSRVGLMTPVGAWSSVGPVTAVPDTYRGAVPDGAGGAFVLGTGGGASDAVLWRIANANASVTFRPRSNLVKYGKSLMIGGYATRAGGLPMDPSTTDILVGKMNADAFVRVATAAAETDGYYQTSVRPTANATWTATAGGAWGDRVTIKVAPRVTLALSHLKPRGTRLTEIFSGTVAPRHAGKRVVVQKAVRSGWRTVASGRLDSRSRYRVTWSLPYRTATYKVRVALPAHADHAEGASLTARLRVVIRRR